jgi:hypothetical protein
MKRTYHMIVLVAVAFAVTACYKDLSTEADKTIPDIVISSESDVINAAYGDEITISPTVTEEGRTAEDFTYHWEVDLKPDNSINRIDLGDSTALSYKVGQSPSDNPYYITLTVTDKVTGIAAMKGWKMYVSNSLGEGLLVAYTRDGGKTSDMDLVSSPAITYGYSGTTAHYTRNLYSFANGAPVAGRINAILSRVCSSAAVFNESTIVVGSDKHIFTLNPTTYKFIKQDNELFNSTTETSFGTTDLFNYAGYFSAAVVSGTLYGIVCNSDNSYSRLKYSLTPSNFFAKENVAFSYMDQGSLGAFAADQGKFYYMMGWMSMNGGFDEVPGTLSFSLTGAKALAAGPSKSMSLAWLLKAADNSYHIVRVDMSGNDPVAEEYLVNGDGLDQAVCYAFCDNADVMYYATSSKIYSVILSGGKATVKALSWTPDSSSEKITGIQQYIQAWYGTQQIYLSDYAFPIATNRLQMVVTTYNEATGEGKLYIRPFNVSTGLFTFKDNGTLSGFGQITAVTSTLR